MIKDPFKFKIPSTKWNLYGKTTGRKYISKEKWWYLFDKENGKCKKCGKKFSLVVKPHIDHRKPISRGGAKTKLSNLQLLCAKCNLKKSDKYGKRGKASSRRPKNPFDLPKVRIPKIL